MKLTWNTVTAPGVEIYEKANHQNRTQFTQTVKKNTDTTPDDSSSIHDPQTDFQNLKCGTIPICVVIKVGTKNNFNRNKTLNNNIKHSHQRSALSSFICILHIHRSPLKPFPNLTYHNPNIHTSLRPCRLLIMKFQVEFHRPSFNCGQNVFFKHLVQKTKQPPFLVTPSWTLHNTIGTSCDTSLAERDEEQKIF
jgi:hypothetical protein